MKNTILSFLRCSIFFGVFFIPVNSWAVYNSHISKATQWLNEQQNTDGSWGTVFNGQFVLTIEAIQALQASGSRNVAYYKGLTWLENHATANVDYATRRALVLNAHGADVQTIINSLAKAQHSVLVERKGWGIDNEYLQSPLDTALVLVSLNAVVSDSGSSNVNFQLALDYLKTSQIGTAGWPISLESVSDPFSTAWVIKAMVGWKEQDSTLVTRINNGVETLSSSVNNSSPDHLQALAAHAALMAGHVSTAKAWLTILDSNQNANGSWSARVYDTALAIRAFSAADGLDNTDNFTPVIIPDANLRMSINTALGHNALDALDRRDLSQLTTLSINNLSVKDLTGLEWATNLKLLDLRNNDITSLNPISDLSKLATVLNDNDNSELPFIPTLLFTKHKNKSKHSESTILQILPAIVKSLKDKVI